MIQPHLFQPTPPSGASWFFNRMPIVSRPDPRFALTMELGARVTLALFVIEQEQAA